MAKAKESIASFTMVEVLIAVILLLFSLGLLLTAFVSSKRSMVLAQARVTALQLAGLQAERLLTNVYTNITTSSVVVTNAGIKYTITNSIATNVAKYMVITYVVRWVSPDSSNSRVLTNYVLLCNTN